MKTNCYSERYIPEKSKLNFQIKKENLRLNDHSLNLISSLFSEEDCQIATQTRFGDVKKDRKEMKVLSFCGPYTSRDKRIASRCVKEEKKSKKSKIEYKLSELSIMDAPGVIDNWYYTLMSWNQMNNKIAVALSDEIYLFDFNSKKIKRVIPMQEQQQQQNESKIVTSVEWICGSKMGEHHLSYGDIQGDVHVIDHVVGRRLRKLNANDGGNAHGVSSIYCLASRGEHQLTAGTRDGKVLHHDLRMRKSLTSKQNLFSAITSVGWSQDGSKFSCGLLDNIAYVFEDSCISNSHFLPLYELNHKSAVGNVKFCPHNNNLLATAGGIYDKSVRFFEISTGQCLNEVNAHKQVCDIAWMNGEKLMICAEDEIMFLSSKSKNPLFTQTTCGSKDNRILSLSVSKDCQSVCTLDRDEQFNIYQFEANKKEASRSALWDQGCLMR